nr:hypothetical protein [uncultured bacterium]
MQTKTSRGFTLIELLVVIAIIGILSSVVLASLNSARQKGRDARRISDIKQLQLALELYYDANQSYPATAAGGALHLPRLLRSRQTITSRPSHLIRHRRVRMGTITRRLAMVRKRAPLHRAPAMCFVQLLRGRRQLAVSPRHLQASTAALPSVQKHTACVRKFLEVFSARPRTRGAVLFFCNA